MLHALTLLFVILNAYAYCHKQQLTVCGKSTGPERSAPWGLRAPGRRWLLRYFKGVKSFEN